MARRTNRARHAPYAPIATATSGQVRSAWPSSPRVLVAQPAIYVVMGMGLGPDGDVVDAALQERLRDKVEALAVAVRDAHAVAAARSVASAA